MQHAVLQVIRDFMCDVVYEEDGFGPVKINAWNDAQDDYITKHTRMTMDDDQVEELTIYATLPLPMFEEFKDSPGGIELADFGRRHPIVISNISKIIRSIDDNRISEFWESVCDSSNLYQE